MDKHRQRGGSSTDALTLSLFLVVLAFFIVLNTISGVDKVKADKALRSIESTFATDSSLTFAMSIDPDSADEGDPGDTFLNAVEDRFKRDVQKLKSARSRDGSRLDMEVPMPVFFGDGTHIPHKTVHLIVDVARMLDNMPKDLRYDLDILTRIASHPPEGAETIRVINQSGLLARTLVKAEIPDNALSIGIEHGDVDWLKLSFSVRKADIPRMDLSTFTKWGVY